MEYGADPDLEPGPRLRENKKRPTPFFQAVRSEKMLKTLLGYSKKTEMLSRANQLGKTPLVLVAESENTEQNE